MMTNTMTVAGPWANHDGNARRVLTVHTRIDGQTVVTQVVETYYGRTGRTVRRAVVS